MRISAETLDNVADHNDELLGRDLFKNRERSPAY